MHLGASQRNGKIHTPWILCCCVSRHHASHTHNHLQDASPGTRGEPHTSRARRRAQIPCEEDPGTASTRLFSSLRSKFPHGAPSLAFTVPPTDPATNTHTAHVSTAVLLVPHLPTMAPQLVGITLGLAMVAAVVLSAPLPAAAAAAAPPTATRQQRQPSARAAPPGVSSNRFLAWGSWDKKRSQDRVTPRIPGTATALSDETRLAGAGGARPPVLDRSWTHAAFRAFHEMRAGCPPPSAVADGDGREQGESGRGEGRGPLAGVRRLASNFPRCARTSFLCSLFDAGFLAFHRI